MNRRTFLSALLGAVFGGVAVSDLDESERVPPNAGSASEVQLNGRDPQTVLDGLEPYQTLVADPANARTLDTTLTITTTGVKVRGLNLTAADGMDAHMVEIRADDVAFSRNRLDGNKANQTGNSTYDSVKVVAATNVSVNRNYSVDSHRMCVVFDAKCTNGEAKFNRGDNPDRDVVNVQGSASDVPTGFEFSFNEGYNTGQSTVSVDEGRRIRMIGNYNEGGATCVQIEDHGEAETHGVTAIGNMAYGSASVIRFSNNLPTRHVSLLGNVGWSLTGNGIYAASANLKEDLTASFNILLGGVTGLDVWNAPAAQFIGNTVTDTSQYGIRARNCNGVKVSLNTVLNAAYAGIQHEETDGAAHKGGNIGRNTVKNSDAGYRNRSDNSTLTHYLVSDNTFIGNTTNVDDQAVGTGSNVTDNITG